MAQFRLIVNGEPREVAGDPETPLLYVLRDELRVRGPKFGCGLGQCGSCAVLLDGKAVRSCVLPIARARGRRIVTLEGLPATFRLAFEAEQAAQCGYCIPGMMVQAASLLNETPHPTDAQIRKALNGNLCRCGTHLRILRAVKRAAGADS